MQMNRTGDFEKIVIVGGGVIGGMCAWYLRAHGFQVTVVDRDRFGAACSHGNCGYVSPSHILPLTQPGAIGTALKSLLRRNSPLRIKIGLSPARWKWFWKFSRHCNYQDMMQSAAGRHLLLQSSQSLYKQLIADQKLDCEWQERGLLFVFSDARHFDHYAHTNRLLNENFGVSATPYDARQMVELEPALKPGLGGAWHYEGDCHLRPDKLMSSLRAKLETLGVKFVDHFPVDQFHRERSMASAISSGNQSIDGDAFVVATGSMTPFLNQQLGCNIPIQPGKGYSLTMPQPRLMPRIPMVFEQHRVAITPLNTKYRIGSTMEFAGYDTSIDRKRLNLLKTAAEIYLHDPHTTPVEEEWYGWRPMTWDGKPIIDRAPVMKNVWIAAGHNMLGVSMATGTGKLISEWISGQQPHIDLHHYSLARFQT
jgi:D-amino-acid dehydrogenase